MHVLSHQRLIFLGFDEAGISFYFVSVWRKTNSYSNILHEGMSGTPQTFMCYVLQEDEFPDLKEADRLKPSGKLSEWTDRSIERDTLQA